MPRIIGPALSLVQILNLGIGLALLALVSRLAYIVLSPPISDTGPVGLTAGMIWGISNLCALIAYLRILFMLGKKIPKSHKIPTSHRDYFAAAIIVYWWPAVFFSFGLVPLPGMVLYGFQNLANLWLHFFSVLTFKATLRANKDDQGAYGLLYGTENRLVSVAPTSPQKSSAPGPVKEVGKVVVVSE